MSVEQTLTQRLLPPNHWDWSMETPFSQGWRIGDHVYVGGQISADEQGKVIGAGDIEVQTRTVFQNIEKVLREAGASWKDVFKMNTFYVFDGEGEEVTEFWNKMTAVRLEFIESPGPCGSAVRVAGLLYPELLIEVEVIALVNGLR
jgi:enamine deaminase RidA (YjgF/YER057c/UK114 family)